MKCLKCGQQLDPGVTFCGNCGQPVQAAQPVQPAANVVMPQTAAAPAQPVAAPAPVAPAAAPAPMSAPAMPMPTAGGAAAMAMPAYSMPQQFVQPGAGKAIAALVLGILGLVGWLIPIVGLVLGVLALVFGTMSTHSPHRKFAIAGIIMGVVAIGLSIFAFVYNLQHDPNLHRAAAAANMQTVDTPCYSAQFSKTLTITNTPGSCVADLVDDSAGSEYFVKVVEFPAMTDAKLKVAAESDIQNVVSLNPGTQIVSKADGKFVGSSSEIYKIADNKGGSATIEYINHPSKTGPAIFIVGRSETTSGDSSLDDLEASWQWK